MGKLKLYFGFKLLLFLSILSISSPVLPYIISYSHWQYDEKSQASPTEIFNLGNYQVANKADSEQLTAIKQAINQWSKKSRPSLFLLEEFCDNEKIKSIDYQSKLNLSTGLLTQIRVLARTYDWQHGSVIFKASDCREKIFYDVAASFFFSAKKILNALKGHNIISSEEMNRNNIKAEYEALEPTMLQALDKWMNNNPQGWNNFEKFKSTLLSSFATQARQVSKSDLLNHLTAKTKEAHEFLEKYPSLKDFDDQLTTSLNKFKKILEEYPDTMSIIELFITRYEKNKSFEKTFDELTNTFMEAYNIIAATGFLSEIIKGLSSYQQIAVYVGEEHAYNLNLMIASLTNAHEIKFKLVSKEKIDEEDEYKPVDSIELKNILSDSIEHSKKLKTEPESSQAIIIFQKSDDDSKKPVSDN